MNLCLTLQPPARSGDDSPKAPQERHFEDIPPAVADQIVDDFQDYKENASEEDQYKLYRYQANGHRNSPQNGSAENPERLLALDFGEIVALEASPNGASKDNGAMLE